MTQSYNSPLDCLIIGGGPAGLTAALYLARFERRFLVIDAGSSRAASIPKSHNIPMFPAGISGPKLLHRQRRNLAGYGDGFIIDGNVESVEAIAGGFRVNAQSNGRDRTFEARTILLSTGAQDVEPALGDVKDAVSRGLVRYCPICDGFEARDKDIAVLGHAARGLGEAIFIARTYEARVNFLTQGFELHVKSEERQRAARFGVQIRNASVESIWADRDCIVMKLDGQNLRFDTVYSALGLAPRSGLAMTLGAKGDESGALIVDDHQRTSVPGLYAAGGVVQGLDQIVVAMGHAAVAATDIHNHCDRILD